MKKYCFQFGKLETLFGTYKYLCMIIHHPPNISNYPHLLSQISIASNIDCYEYICERKCVLLFMEMLFPSGICCDIMWVPSSSFLPTVFDSTEQPIIFFFVTVVFCFNHVYESTSQSIEIESVIPVNGGVIRFHQLLKLYTDNLRKHHMQTMRLT